MSARLVAAACTVLLASCPEPEDPGAAGDAASAPEDPPTAPASAPSGPSGRQDDPAGADSAEPSSFEPPEAGDETAVPAGTVELGSPPATVGRDARNEADLRPVRVPAFRIDRLPYPNDPAEPPRTDVTREQAASLCAERGQRLCTELEWERACKGDGVGPFPGGATLDVEQCSIEPVSCATPFGVLAMGVHAAEWTASEATPGLVRGEATAVVRGAAPDAEPVRHRCASRRAADPSTHSETTGFRCCRGPRPEITYPEPPVRRTFREKDVDAARLREIMRGLPELEPWADDFDPRGAMGVAAALGQSEPPEAAPNGWATSTAPVLAWSPVRGEEAWVVTGTGAGSTVLAVLQPTRSGFVHGASFVLKDEVRPIAVLHTPDSPHELQWTACWSCAGESGTIEYRREQATFAVLHR